MAYYDFVSSGPRLVRTIDYGCTIRILLDSRFSQHEVIPRKQYMRTLKTASNVYRSQKTHGTTLARLAKEIEQLDMAEDSELLSWGFGIDWKIHRALLHQYGDNHRNPLTHEYGHASYFCLIQQWLKACFRMPCWRLDYVFPVISPEFRPRTSSRRPRRSDGCLANA